MSSRVGLSAELSIPKCDNVLPRPVVAPADVPTLNNALECERVRKDKRFRDFNDNLEGMSRERRYKLVSYFEESEKLRESCFHLGKVVNHLMHENESLRRSDRNSADFRIKVEMMLKNMLQVLVVS